MMIPIHEPVPDGRRFGPDPLRIAIFALFACGVYGSGIGAEVWAGYLTMTSMRAGAGLPVLPWVLAFVLVVSGMLAVIYGFFFRPRECRLDGDRVGLVYWDGTGKVMDRSAVESMDLGTFRIILRGGGKKLVVGSMFSDWKSLRGELAAWDTKASRGA